MSSSMHDGGLSAGDGAPGEERRSRVLVLIVTALIAIAFFTVTWFVNSGYQSHRETLAVQWTAVGEQDLGRGDASAAVEAFRSALTYEPDNPTTTLKLAESLVRAGREQEASAYLLGLLQQEPGNGPVNLAMARIAARRREVAEALRYYHGAIYGGWSGEGQTMRRQAQLELIDFLLTQQDATEARAELIGLTADLPRDGTIVASVADRFLRAGDDDNALRLYREAMTLRNTSPQVQAGAGLAAFHAGHYREAIPYLEHAKAAGLESTVNIALETSRAVLELDPYAHGISRETRTQRTRRGLEIAMARVTACRASAPPNAIAPGAAGVVQQVDTAQQLDVAGRELGRGPADMDTVDAVMSTIFQAEQSVARCPGQTPQDAALALITRERQAQER